MKPRLFSHEHTRTAYVQLDTRKCKACWKCLEDCPNQVISKIDLPWHKHAIIVLQDACTGCLNCINICEHNAYTIIEEINQETEKRLKGLVNRFLINNLLLVSCVLMILSGLVLQLGFHVGESGEHQLNEQVIQSQPLHYEQARGIDANKTIWGANYSDWSTIHKFAIVFFSISLTYHIYVHWKWYKTVITKQLLGKNIQVITLSILFLLVAVTGLIPWFVDLSGSTSSLRLIFIEIHDKLALVLAIYLVLHLIKRNKWFMATYLKLRN